MKRVLLLGAGHAHALALSRFGEKPLQGAELMLVAPRPEQVYSGMVPGYLAGHYGLEQISIDLRRVAQRAGAELVLGRVAALDPERRRVRLEDGREIAYDAASLNVGSLTAASFPGARLATPVKPLDDFLAAFQARSPKSAAIVGGGASGAELAMALAWRGLGVALYYEEPPEPRLAAALKRSGVQARIHAAVERIEPGFDVITQDTAARFDFVALATGAAPHPWLRGSGLALDERGFVLVDRTLRSASHADVFAVGDSATLESAPHPKSGVYSVRHGEILERNLRALARGEDRLERYKPQPRSLMLVSCGGRRAIAFWGGLRAEGAWAWRLKDAIDRRWIARLR